MRVKNKLLDIRLQRGFKFQKDFSEFLGVDPSHYNRYEKNKIQPSLEQIYKILQKLNIGFFDLFYLD